MKRTDSASGLRVQVEVGAGSVAVVVVSGENGEAMGGSGVSVEAGGEVTGAGEGDFGGRDRKAPAVGEVGYNGGGGGADGVLGRDDGLEVGSGVIGGVAGGGDGDLEGDLGEEPMRIGGAS